jgi:hypothetical protein
MGCLGLFLAPLGFLVVHPFLGFLPAAVFLFYYWVRRPAAAERDSPGRVRWSLLAGLVWLVYSFYELAMAGWSRSIAGAPIRIDLFLLGPVLYVLTALALGMATLFEMGERGVLVPSIPNPYSRKRDRAFVIRIAILLASLQVLDILVWISLGVHDVGRKIAVLLLVLLLSVYLVRGYPWARWLLLLWLAYSALFYFIGWSSLRSANRQGLANIRLWDLAAAVLALALGVVLVVSKRLRDHLTASAQSNSAVA